MSEIGPFPSKHTPLSPDSSKREPYLSLDQNLFPPLTYSEYRENTPLFTSVPLKIETQPAVSE